MLQIHLLTNHSSLEFRCAVHRLPVLVVLVGSSHVLSILWLFSQILLKCKSGMQQRTVNSPCVWTALAPEQTVSCLRWVLSPTLCTADRLRPHVSESLNRNVKTVSGLFLLTLTAVLIACRTVHGVRMIQPSGKKSIICCITRSLAHTWSDPQLDRLKAQSCALC